MNNEDRLTAEWLSGFARACVMFNKKPKGFANAEQFEQFSRACLTAEQIQNGGTFNPFWVVQMRGVAKRLKPDD